MIYLGGWFDRSVTPQKQCNAPPVNMRHYRHWWFTGSISDGQGRVVACSRYYKCASPCVYSCVYVCGAMSCLNERSYLCLDQWRIIACESSDYRHIVHDDGFVWLMFVDERFSASEQTLNSQNHGVHYMSVITRLTCNNSILLTRNSPDWQTYRDDTADDTVLCISGIVLGITGLRLWLACVHKGNIRTS